MWICRSLKRVNLERKTFGTLMFFLSTHNGDSKELPGFTAKISSTMFSQQWPLTLYFHSWLSSLHVFTRDNCRNGQSILCKVLVWYCWTANEYTSPVMRLLIVNRRANILSLGSRNYETWDWNPALSNILLSFATE